jgi:hypothetical protein
VFTEPLHSNGRMRHNMLGFNASMFVI